MKKRLIALSLLNALGCVLRGGATTPADDRLWATRITCELQTAGPVSLPALYWQQGTSPLLSLDQYRSGRAVDADTNVTAVLRLAPTATNLAGWVSVTNYATVGNGYLVQMPTVGTNTTASGAWWYTAYFMRGTAVYWTGSGRVTITATTSTGADGLVWQEILPPGACLTWEQITGKPTTFPPSSHTHPYTDITDPPWLTEYTETDEIALAALYGTNAILRAAITNEAALRVTHTNDTENPHQVTPAQIGAATTGELAAVEAALAGYQSAAYWPPNATASSWFTFTTNSGAITITGYNIDGGTAVVIPDYINGFPVTEIGESAFEQSGVTSIGGAGNVVTVGDGAFISCGSLASVSLPQAQTVGAFAFNSCNALTSVSLPQAQTVGTYAFSSCGSLASVSLPQAKTVGGSAFGSCYSLTSILLPQAQTVGGSAFYFCYSLTSVYFDNDAPTIGAEIFAEITENQVTNYVTNPTATGWGATLGGMPVVRLPLYADAIYQDGELVATTGHVAQAIAAIEFPVTSTNYTAWTGTVTPADGTATVAIAHGNMPVLVTDAPCVLTLDPTGYGTAGVSRVSLSYYPGTNSFTFATNIIKYAETPTVDTNGWNGLLIRRISNGTWKGVGL